MTGPNRYDPHLVLPSGLVLTDPADVEMIQELRARRADAEYRAGAAEAQLATEANSMSAVMEKIKATSRREHEVRWMQLSAFRKLVPTSVVSSTKIWEWCVNYMTWNGDDATRPLDMIVSRQLGGINTPVELDMNSAWEQIERYAFRKDKTFVRPI